MPMLVCKTSTSTSSTFKRQSKIITTRAPCPYGTIPKRRAKQDQDPSQQIHHALKTKKKKNKSALVPYPLPTYAASPHSSLFASFFSLFDDGTKTAASPVGFVPPEPEALLSPLNGVAPVTVTSDGAPEWCRDDTDGVTMQDTCSCVSISTTSTISCGSTEGCSSLADDLWWPSPVEPWNEPDVLDVRSTTALSDLLCDHYVQTQTVAEGEVDVELETFRMFESPHDETPLENKLWLVHDWLQPKKWTEVGVDETLDATMCVEEHMTLPSFDTGEEKQSESRHVRDIRSNSAHLRMLVAEINMMRADKIVGPLRPRAHLPKRLDRFIAHRPSQLRYT